MGCRNNIDYDKFPKQGRYLGKRVDVLFHYSGDGIKGTIVRDDGEAPFLTIIQLDNGRIVLTTECQYSPEKE